MEREIRRAWRRSRKRSREGSGVVLHTAGVGAHARGESGARAVGGVEVERLEVDDVVEHVACRSMLPA